MFPPDFVRDANPVLYYTRTCVLESLKFRDSWKRKKTKDRTKNVPPEITAGAQVTAKDTKVFGEKAKKKKITKGTKGLKESATFPFGLHLIIVTSYP